MGDEASGRALAELEPQNMTYFDRIQHMNEAVDLVFNHGNKQQEQWVS